MLSIQIFYLDMMFWKIERIIHGFDLILRISETASLLKEVEEKIRMPFSACLIVHVDGSCTFLEANPQYDGQRVLIFIILMSLDGIDPNNTDLIHFLHKLVINYDIAAFEWVLFLHLYIYN
jgi:hypothetical protein